MTIEEKKNRLAQLRQEVAELEREIGGRPEHWQAREYYTMYHATAGFMLGIAGAAASLLFNVIGSVLVKQLGIAGFADQHPLRLIQVYLTFPLGERALDPEFSSGIVLAFGCCLYLGTGMLLGVPFQMLMARFLPDGKLPARLVLATIIGLILWGVNFYGVLAWLQPALLDGNWITDPTILPPWVGAATHLVFAWTMACVYPWGKYEPYRRQTDASLAA